MADLLGKQWFRLGAGGLLMAVLGAVVAVVATAGVASDSGVADQLSFYYIRSRAHEQLPLTAASASSAGWDGTTRCIVGQGRLYQRASGADEPYPVMPVYDVEGGLVGIQLHSRAEQPAPWVHAPDGLPNTQVENLEFPHWRVGIYLVPPIKACAVTRGGSGYSG